MPAQPDTRALVAGILKSTPSKRVSWAGVPTDTEGHAYVFQGFREVHAGIYRINVSVQTLMQNHQIAAVLIRSFLSGL